MVKQIDKLDDTYELNFEISEKFMNRYKITSLNASVKSLDFD